MCYNNVVISLYTFKKLDFTTLKRRSRQTRKNPDFCEKVVAEGKCGFASRRPKHCRETFEGYLCVILVTNQEKTLKMSKKYGIIQN